MKVTRVGGRISRDRLPPGGQANHGWLAPRGATCPGGKINWDTGKGSNSTKVMGFFSALFAMLCSLLQLSCRKNKNALNS